MDNEAEAQEVTQEATQETQEAPKQERPAGYDPVDLNGVPDEIKERLEQRFGYFMRQIRENKQNLNEYRGLVVDQGKKIEELMSGVGQVVDHLQSKSFGDSEAQIKQQMKAAHESGDTDAFIAANEKMTELKAQKIALKNQPKPTPKQERTQNYNSAAEMANQAAQDGEIPSEDGVAIQTWQGETAPDGNLLRPWAHNRSNDPNRPDPLYRRALLEAAAVFDEASPYASKTTAEKLAEVDRRMGLQTNRGTQSVMGGSLTSARKSNKLTLSPDAERVAIRMKLAGPKATDADHIAKYRKQLEGSRK